MIVRNVVSWQQMGHSTTLLLDQRCYLQPGSAADFQVVGDEKRRQIIFCTFPDILLWPVSCWPTYAGTWAHRRGNHTSSKRVRLRYTTCLAKEENTALKTLCPRQIINPSIYFPNFYTQKSCPATASNSITTAALCWMSTAVLWRCWCVSAIPAAKTFTLPASRLFLPHFWLWWRWHTSWRLRCSLSIYQDVLVSQEPDNARLIPNNFTQTSVAQARGRAWYLRPPSLFCVAITHFAGINLVYPNLHDCAFWFSRSLTRADQLTLRLALTHCGWPLSFFTFLPIMTLETFRGCFIPKLYIQNFKTPRFHNTNTKMNNKLFPGPYARIDDSG